MNRHLLVVLLLVASAAAAPVTEEDPEGDPAQRVFGVPVAAPPVDILLVEGEMGEVLRLRIEVAGDLPVTAPDDPERRYTYLFIVAEGEGSGSLYGLPATTVNCHFHAGQRDLVCEVTQGEATLRAIGHAGRNVTAELAVPWEGAFRVGAAAHESLPNGTQRDIVAQDFTQNALPYQQPPPTDAPERATPWYKTPWILLVVALAGLAVWAVAAWRR